MLLDSIRSLLGFHETIFYKKHNLSPNLVDNLSFYNIFLESDIAKRMILKGGRSGIIHIWTMTVDPGFKYVEKFAGCFFWYMMETKGVVSSFFFRLKIENKELVSFNGQSISFELSFKKTCLLYMPEAI